MQMEITSSVLACPNCSSIVINKTHNERDSGKEYWQRWSDGKFRGRMRLRFLILSLSPFVSIKHLLGVKEVTEEDSLRDKIYKSIVLRQSNRYTEAIELLHDALKEAYDGGNDMHITRICDELANAHYEFGINTGDRKHIEASEVLFRRTIQRLIQLHRKSELSPEFIGISLKLADCYARKGELRNAEIGYKHCVGKQMKILDDAMKNFYIDKGAILELNSPVDYFGIEYSEPHALFGMALEEYAHFLVNYFDDDRMPEAEEFINDTIKISYHIYGVHHNAHSVQVVNNFAARCILRNRFETAKKYLELIIHRVDEIKDGPFLCNFYCNYAETLFHTGEIDKAIEYAKLAVKCSEGQHEAIEAYANSFCRKMERDARRNRGRRNITDKKTSQ